MPTLEFKPMGTTKEAGPALGITDGLNMAKLAEKMSSIDDIVWTCPRSPAPPQLLGKAGDALWAETYDLVKLRVQRGLEIQKEQMGRMAKVVPSPLEMCCPCCLCCKMCCGGGAGAMKEQMAKSQTDAASEQKLWLVLVQDQQTKYSPLGIHVALLQETHLTGGGNTRVRETIVTVGLKFESSESFGGAPPATAVIVGAVANPIAEKIERPAEAEESALDKLAKLAKLKDAGVISQEEFDEKKEKLMQEI
jgi:hypothetical protein